MALPEQSVLPKTHAQLIVAHSQLIDPFRRREIDPLLVEDRLFFLQPQVHETCRTREERTEGLRDIFGLYSASKCHKKNDDHNINTLEIIKLKTG